jgi:hypothetical protein
MMKSQCERLAENVQHIDVHQMQSQNGPETDSLINSTMPHLDLHETRRPVTWACEQLQKPSRNDLCKLLTALAKVKTQSAKGLQEWSRKSSAGKAPRKKKPKEFWRCKSYEGNQVPSQKPKSRPARVAAKETKHVGGKARGLLKLLM